MLRDVIVARECYLKTLYPEKCECSNIKEKGGFDSESRGASFAEPRRGLRLRVGLGCAREGVKRRVDEEKGTRKKIEDSGEQREGRTSLETNYRCK